MTIPTTGKGLMLERMTRIFTGKGCRVHAANAFLNHVHVLVEIPNSGDFSKIVNKVKGGHGNGIPEKPRNMPTSPVGLPDSTRSACRSATFTGSDGTSRSSIQSIRRSRSRKNTDNCLKRMGSTRIKRPCRHPPRYIFPRIPTLKTESNDLYEIHTFLATARLSVRIVRAGNHTTHPPDRRGHGVGKRPRKKSAVQKTEVRLARTEREHCLIDGRHSDVQFVRVRQELRTRHALHRCFPRARRPATRR